jgi:hypothetical protein
MQPAIRASKISRVHPEANQHSPTRSPGPPAPERVPSLASELKKRWLHHHFGILVFAAHARECDREIPRPDYWRSGPGNEALTASPCALPHRQPLWHRLYLLVAISEGFAHYRRATYRADGRASAHLYVIKRDVSACLGVHFSGRWRLRIVISNGHSVSNAKYRMVTGRAWIAHRCNGRVGRRRGPTHDERTAYNVSGQSAASYRRAD